MKSLMYATVDKANNTIKEELTSAGIKPVEITLIKRVEYGAVGTSIIGVWNNYIFYRMMYCYKAVGDVPFTVVDQITEKTENCRIVGNFFGWKKLDFKKEYPTAKCVPNYEIDTLEDLKNFIEILNQNGAKA